MTDRASRLANIVPVPDRPKRTMAERENDALMRPRQLHAAPSETPAPETKTTPVKKTKTAAGAPASPAKKRGPVASITEPQRLGVYIPQELYDAAKAAAQADYNNLPDSPDTFGSWLSKIITDHAKRSPAARARIVKTLQPLPGEGKPKNRTMMVEAAAIAAADAAVSADWAHEIFSSRAGLAADAMRAAHAAAVERNGGPLRKAPTRMPNRLVRIND